MQTRPRTHCEARSQISSRTRRIGERKKKLSNSNCDRNSQICRRLSSHQADFCAVEIICRLGLPMPGEFCSIKHAANGCKWQLSWSVSMQRSNRSLRSFPSIEITRGEEGNGRQQKAEIKYRSMTIDRSDKHDALDLNPLSHLVLPFFLPRPPPRLWFNDNFFS
jgi:hypothetical protein